MDFGALPPEINSGRMYSGPGSAPMRAASAAWNLLAAELESAATQYQSTIDVLDDEWLGPTSATMAAAVDPYITWMSTTGAQAEQTAAQASAAASAYEAAFAMTVPPVEVAANRAQLAMLVATNVIGQNTAAIAANEAMYGEMWAQDAAAMYGYAGTSAAASSVKAFSQPPETSNPAAQATQGSAVTQANGASTGSGVQSQLQQLTSTIPSSLKQLTSPISAATNAATQPASALTRLPQLPRRRGREPHRNLPQLHLLERSRVGLIRQPRAHHARDHQRFGRHQLVGTGRRSGGAWGRGAWGRGRYRHDQAAGAGTVARAWAFR